MMLSRQLKNAIMESIKAKIERRNYGMLSNYSVGIDNLKLLDKYDIEIKNNDIFMKESLIGKIHRKYSTKKLNGMYKELKPKIEWF